MLDFIELTNTVLAVVLTAAYAYQLFFLAYGIVYRRKASRKMARVLNRYGVIICARNESAVIGDLIASLKQQKYPQQLLDVYVVADNCTDNTAQISRRAGAFVYERYNKVQVGKGYAMDYFFHRLMEEGKLEDYAGFFVFDADNLVDPNFVSEMNNTFTSGEYSAITSYRNSKNFASNWISAGYALWFLRESRFLNFPRQMLGINCAISGTGFLLSTKVVKEHGGWPFHLLTEDIQFSVNCAIQGQRIGYCDRAVIYDEQPTRFSQSWAQRLRWSKGFYQVDVKYAFSLVKRCFSGKRRFSCYDMLMTVAPGMLLTLAALLLNGICAVACFTLPAYQARMVLAETTNFIFSAFSNFYLVLLLYGLATTISEWKKIYAPTHKKILYVFTFPLFMFAYVPIALSALVRKVEWKPIQHGCATAIKEIP